MDFFLDESESVSSRSGVIDLLRHKIVFKYSFVFLSDSWILLFSFLSAFITSTKMSLWLKSWLNWYLLCLLSIFKIGKWSLFVFSTAKLIYLFIIFVTNCWSGRLNLMNSSWLFLLSIMFCFFLSLRKSTIFIVLFIF